VLCALLQSGLLGLLLATRFFADPLVALPCGLSTIFMTLVSTTPHTHKKVAHRPLPEGQSFGVHACGGLQGHAHQCMPRMNRWLQRHATALPFFTNVLHGCAERLWPGGVVAAEAGKDGAAAPVALRGVLCKKKLAGCVYLAMCVISVITTHCMK
jgi:hypothetical protein